MSTVDTTTKQGCLELIQKAISELGPVDGVFNLCVVLKDAFFEDQTEETFKESLSSKANIAVALDQVTRQCCKNLRYLILDTDLSLGVKGTSLCFRLCRVDVATLAKATMEWPTPSWNDFVKKDEMMVYQVWRYSGVP